MAEDFNKLKMISRAMRRTDFKKPWDFKLVIEGLAGLSGELLAGTEVRAREDVTTFDLLCKGISYGPTTIETEQIRAGSVTITIPTGTNPTEISLTMRDTSSGLFRKWFAKRAEMVVNKDGTFNLPKDSPSGPGYLIKMARISLIDPTDVEIWDVLPTKLGDISLEVDGEGFTEFPATFVQFNSGA